MKTKYETFDGKLFDSETEAAEYEKKEMLDEGKRTLAGVAKIKETYWYREHGSKIDPHKISTWMIYGEDPNCDYGGYHYQPLLATVHGTFNKALTYAARLSGYWTWGAGGDIREVKVEKL